MSEARPLRCIVCRETITDYQRGWVRPRVDGPIYGLCDPDAARIMRDEVALQWQDDKPVVTELRRVAVAVEP